MTFKLPVLISMYLMFSAFAERSFADSNLQSILSINVKGHSEVAQVQLDTNEIGDLRGIQVDPGTTELSGEKTAPTYMAIDKVVSAKPGSDLVFMSYEGRDIAAVATENFNPITGGIMNIRYLVNGVSNDAKKRIYDTIQFEVVNSPSSKAWSLFANPSSGRMLVTQVLMKPNMKNVGPFGILRVMVGISEVSTT